ncbi:MAG: hypothetical protein WCX69_03015 [Candidatus Paceibacterota bacterium]
MRINESPDFADSPTKPDLRLTDTGNKGLFERLGKKGKNIASGVFARANDPLKKYDLLAGLLIGFNEDRTKIEEKKAIRSETEVFNLNGQIETEQTLAKLMQQEIESLKAMGVPTGELESNLKESEQKIRDLSRKKDLQQTNCEARTNKMSELANYKADAADMAIECYQKAIKDLEIEQDALLTQKKGIEIRIEKMKISHEIRTQELDEYSKQKAQLKVNMLVNGINEYEIKTNSNILYLTKLIADGNQQMRMDMSDLTITKEEIIAQIIKIDKQIAEYRDKAIDYGRNKEIKPISITLPERYPQKSPADETQIEIHHD